MISALNGLNWGIIYFDSQQFLEMVYRVAGYRLINQAMCIRASQRRRYRVLQNGGRGRASNFKPATNQIVQPITRL